MPRISKRVHAIHTIFVEQRECFFCYTRFHHVFILVKPFLLKKFTLFGGNHHLWREPSVAFHCFKIRVPPNRRIAFTLNSSFLSKSVNRPRVSRHMRLYTEDIDNIVRCPFVPPRTRVRVEAKRIPNMSYNEIRWIVVYTFQCNCAKI